MQNGQERLIACISRALTAAERKWTVHEREALAIIWALEKLKSFLVHSRFRIVTDHRNLLWLFRLSNDKGRLSRWASLMSQWSIVTETKRDALLAAQRGRILVHEPGSHLVGPDAFSRMYDVSDGGTCETSRGDLVLSVKAFNGTHASMSGSGVTQESVFSHGTVWRSAPETRASANGGGAG